MPVIVRGKEIEPLEQFEGCKIAQLLTPDLTGNDQVLLDRVTLATGVKFKITFEQSMIGWLQALSGRGTLSDTDVTSDLITYLSMGFVGTFVSGDTETVLLIARVPNAERFDADIAEMPAGLRQIDWTREPVLQSEHDERERVYLATPELARTKAFKGEMITYASGTEAPEHHHVGAEHFQYIISGRGTAILEGVKNVIEAGDILYNYEYERHAFVNESHEKFRFIEFFVPRPCKTIWSPGANFCAWLPTGIDSGGRKPSREIGYHVHGEDDSL